jgi:hypothetical protein
MQVRITLDENKDQPHKRAGQTIIHNGDQAVIV